MMRFSLNLFGLISVWRLGELKIASLWATDFITPQGNSQWDVVVSGPGHGWLAQQNLRGHQFQWTGNVPGFWTGV